MNKKIIITKEQLKRIDETTIALQTDNGGSTPGDVVNTINNNKSSIDAAANATSGNIDVMVTTPKNKETLPPQVLNVNQGENISDVAQRELDGDYLNSGGSVKVGGSGIGGIDNTTNEMKCYTKKQIEEARVKYITENYNIYSKKEINEILDAHTGINNYEDFKETIRSFVSQKTYQAQERLNYYENNYTEIINNLENVVENIRETLKNLQIEVISVSYEHPYGNEFDINYLINWAPQINDFENPEYEKEEKIYGILSDLGNNVIPVDFYENNNGTSNISIEIELPNTLDFADDE